jgi:DmsE family decaheme c-type cytochrome
MKGKEAMRETVRTKILKPGILILAILVASVLFNVNRLTAQSDAKKSPAYQGTELCLSCHDGYDKYLLGTKHGKLFSDEKSKGPKMGCEGCHGPAEKHIEDSAVGVNRFEKMKPADISAACLNCHAADDKKSFKVSRHGLEGVSCVECHSVHGKGISTTARKSARIEHLLKNTEPELCYQCHGSKTAEMSLPSHHPVKQGKVMCSDCHSPHNNSSLEMDRMSDKCVSCHQEKTGPFKYEHTPVAESCLTCHAPHGSVNKDLLIVRQPALCLQCHINTPPEHDTTDLQYKTCTNCHAAIHGSNQSAILDR